MRERLRAEAHAEQRRASVDPAPQRVVLLVQPRMLDLFADVLVAAEHHHRVEVRRRRALRPDVPLDELVAVFGKNLGEELGACVVRVDDGEDPHAVGMFSSSSSLRRSNAPAGACATPWVWLLLLKNAYASAACSES